jgi:hypothetical protein
VTKRKECLIRLDPQVHDALRRWADDDLRSLNAQIEFLLREALRRDGRAPPPAAAAGTDDDAPPAPAPPADR